MAQFPWQKRAVLLRIACTKLHDRWCRAGRPNLQTIGLVGEVTRRICGVVGKNWLCPRNPTLDKPLTPTPSPGVEDWNVLWEDKLLFSESKQEGKVRGNGGGIYFDPLQRFGRPE